MTQWGRNRRSYKVIILGGRAGSSLVHKNLLLTGLLNWGWWSLEFYESEAQVKLHIWANYPNIKEREFQPKYYWNIAKAPEFGMVLHTIIKLYPEAKFIVLERNLEDRLNSLINTWGEDLKTLWKGFPRWFKFLCNEGKLGDDPLIRDLFRVYLETRDKIQEEALEGYDKKLILRINFDDLMNNYDKEMKKIADFLNINFDVYKGLWREMRKIKHMETSTDIKKYVTL